MDAVTLVLIAISVACVLLYRRSMKTKKRLAPEAPGLPIVGRLFSSVPKNFSSCVDALALGDIYRVKMGLLEFYMLNSYQAVHEAFIGRAEVFSGRQKDYFAEMVFRNAGVVNTDGPVWQEHRRLMLRLLREFGLGRPIVANLIDEECAALKEDLDRSRGTPIDTQEMFSSMTNNVIARLIFGERSGTDDDKFKEFAEHLKETLKIKAVNVIPMLFPWVLKVSILRRAFDYFSGLLYHFGKMHEYIRDKIEQQRHALNSMDPPPTTLNEATNICEAFLIEQAKQEAASPGGHTFTEWQLIGNMTDLFAAGTETTATTLNWAMLLMAVHPDIQERIQREIEEKIGRQRPPTMADRQQLPYVCAVMDEVMRFSSLVPFNVIHRTTAETELLGFDIPADALVQSNLYGIHHDPKLWLHPNKMHPEHFLTDEGEYRPSKHLIPFSLGKRACLGESLARMEYFLAFVTLMQTFRVQLADPDVDVDALLGGIMGLIRHPLPHKIVFTRLDMTS